MKKIILRTMERINYEIIKYNLRKKISEMIFLFIKCFGGVFSNNV